jgi:hypothetical protein
MRLLIYFLAMLTGFAAAEAARPVSAVPASVGAASAEAYAAATVKVAEKVHIAPQANEPHAITIALETLPIAEFSAIKPTTPVLRHDIILG